MNQPLISPAECAELAQIMGIKYAAHLDGKEFVISVQQQQEWVYVTVTLKNMQESFYYPVEARIHRDVPLEPREAALFLLDYLDLYFDDYLREKDVYFPLDWAQYVYEGIDFHVRGQILNLEAQRQADALLQPQSHG